MTNIFIRQPFTQSGAEERAIVQDVFDLIHSLINGCPDMRIITDTEAQSGESFVKRFEAITETAFTPSAFRHYRFSLLDKADAIIYIRTGLSESSAFEIAYNIFKGNKAPLLFCTWHKAPLKTTLLRDLDELCDTQYVSFNKVADLKKTLESFLNRFADGGIVKIV